LIPALEKFFQNYVGFETKLNASRLKLNLGYVELVSVALLWLGNTFSVIGGEITLS
jgi:hypothetical protein